MTSFVLLLPSCRLEVVLELDIWLSSVVQLGWVEEHVVEILHSAVKLTWSIRFESLQL